MAVIALPVAWFLGLGIGTTVTAISPFGTPGLFAFGAIGFALIFSSLGYGSLRLHSRGAWWAAAGYWTASWLLFRLLEQVEFFGLLPLLRDSQRGSTAETLALTWITTLGTLAGVLSGAVLALPLIRRNMVGGRWAVIVIMGATALAATFYFSVYWFSHGDSWN